MKTVSKRYCRVCKDFRAFDYDRTINHSSCRECGGRYSLNPEHVDEITEYILKAKKSIRTKTILVYLEERTKIIRNDETLKLEEKARIKELKVLRKFIKQED